MYTYIYMYICTYIYMNIYVYINSQDSLRLMTTVGRRLAHRITMLLRTLLRQQINSQKLALQS